MGEWDKLMIWLLFFQNSTKYSGFPEPGAQGMVKPIQAMHLLTLKSVSQDFLHTLTGLETSCCT